MHDAKGVFKSLVRCPGIDKGRKRQLIDVAQPLEWLRVDECPFASIQLYKVMNRIANLMQSFNCHAPPPKCSRNVLLRHIASRSNLREAIWQNTFRNQLHPDVAPQVSHFSQVPFRTMVKFWHSEHMLPV